MYSQATTEVKLWKKGQIIHGRLLVAPIKKEGIQKGDKLIAIVLEDQKPEQIKVKVLGGLVGKEKKISKWSPYTTVANLQVMGNNWKIIFFVDTYNKIRGKNVI